MKDKLVSNVIIVMIGCLMLCSCDHEKTTTKNYDRFVLTEVMRYNSYFGLSRMVYNKMCRDDGELCIKCVNRNDMESFCDLQIYDDPNTGYLLYADRHDFHLVNSASGAELECKYLKLISEHILAGVEPYWLDGNRLIISSVKNPEVPYGADSGPYVGFEVPLGSQPCVTRQVWSYPTNGYSSGPEIASPNRKGLAWKAYTHERCVLRWFYGDYEIHEKKIDCAHKNFPLDWVGDHPEIRDNH